MSARYYFGRKEGLCKMKVSFVILAAILGGVFALDLPTEPRVWTGWDIASRSGEIGQETVGEPRAWTGWDIASRSAEIEDSNGAKPRAWTGWDIASRSGEMGEETVGESRAWTGWDIASRSAEIEDSNVAKPRAWTGWDVHARSGEMEDETVDVPAARDPRFMNALNAASQRIGGIINKGQELRNEVRKEIRETLLSTIRRMNETLNYYCVKQETGNYTCSVCVELMISNYTLCTNLIVDQINLELTANIRINNFTIIERSIGAQNPPPMCVPIPYVPLCQFCLQAYNLHFNGTKEFKGCLEAELSVRPVHTFTLPLTCIKIDDTGVHFNRSLPENKPAKKNGLLKKLF